MSATLLTREYSIVANVASVSGVSKIVTKAPGGIIEFVAHLRKLAVRRDVNCAWSLTIGHYLALSTTCTIFGTVLLGYLLILRPRTLDRMVQFARKRTARRNMTIRAGIMWRCQWQMRQ
jgi:hypothetical protein